MLSTWLHAFLSDTKVHIALLLVLADFIFGVAAAVKTKTFSLAFVADFMKTDIAFKLVPYLVLYVFAIVAGQTNIVIPGLDFGVIAGSVYAVLVVAWVGSILGSLQQLGFLPNAPQALIRKPGPGLAKPVHKA